jgi:hypothetical protein
MKHGEQRIPGVVGWIRFALSCSLGCKFKDLFGRFATPFVHTGTLTPRTDVAAKLRSAKAAVTMSAKEEAIHLAKRKKASRVTKMKRSVLD